MFLTSRRRFRSHDRHAQDPRWFGRRHFVPLKFKIQKSPSLIWVCPYVSKSSGSQIPSWFHTEISLKSLLNPLQYLEGILGVEFETFNSQGLLSSHIISKSLNFLNRTCARSWSPHTVLWPRFGWAWREGSQVGNAKCSKLSFEHQRKGKMMKDTKRTCTKLQTCCNGLYLYQGKTIQLPTEKEGSRHSFASKAK